jgi:hypothetical protein
MRDVGGYRCLVFVVSRSVVLGGAGLLLGCTNRGDDGTRRCTEVRDHVVELRLAQSRGATDALGQPIDLAPHRAAMKQALGARYIEQCRREMSSSQIKCALSATDSEAASACIRRAR